MCITNRVLLLFGLFVYMGYSYASHEVQHEPSQRLQKRLRPAPRELYYDSAVGYQHVSKLNPTTEEELYWAEEERERCVAFQSGNGKLLLQAARCGDKERVKDLLAMDVPVDFCYDDDLAQEYARTPLSYAAEYGHTAVVALLLSAGAVSHLPHEYDCIDSKKWVDAPHTIDWRDLPLSLAVMRAHAEVAKLLLSAGAWANMVARDGVPPLVWAARSGRMDLLEMLLSAGARVDRSSVEHWERLTALGAGRRTALMEACLCGHLQIVQRLLRAGAQVEPCAGALSSPLCDATLFKHREIIKLLLAAGARVSFQSNLTNAVHIATYNGDETTLRLLLDTDAFVGDPDVPMNEPLILTVALYNRNSAIAKLLVQYGAPFPEPNSAARAFS